ncbi:hypothetical protein SADUNF_Sadunf16G0084100 [Salix dunnii]|uniref:RNase H type-1 domain-containing protein n=1 Tax=Salix dunnii TaxID=1413687 RepID=A0A835J5Q7_9ROSI|nr:hypothetical protein SADUNF_Sadunf16G0084100 [Salix dunnii]
MADTDPFTIVEAHFADAKFYFKSNMMEELRSPPDHLGEGIIDFKSSKRHESSANEGVSQPIKDKGKEKVVEDFVDNKPPRKAATLRYIPISARKEGQSSFAKDEEKINKELENLTLPVTNLVVNKVSKPLLKGFVHQTKSVVNLKGLPDKRSNGFDPNAYKLLARAGYSREDINKISKDDDVTQLEGKQVSARTRKAWREKKMFGKTLKVGLGYESSTPLHFHINKEASQYISAEEVKDEQQSQPTPLRASVWDRLGGTTNRAPVFARIGTQNNGRVLKRTPVLARLGQSMSEETSLMGDSKVLHSKIPSRMKRQFEWVVSAEETLKGKTRTIVITNPSNEEKEDEIMCLTSNHITIEEEDNDKFVVEEDVEEAPSSLESENKPTMDELKEPEFIPYHKYARKLITSLDCVTLEHVPRKENKQADALANLASTLASCSEEIKVPVCQRWVVPPLSHDIEEKEQVGVVSVYEIEREDWRLSNEENVRLRLEELEALDEKRLEAQQRLECYQARLCRAFNKKVRPRSFQEGDLVLAVRRPIIMSKRMGSKFLSKWDGPYVVQEVYTNGAYKIVDENGLRIGPINGKFLKRYYA